MTSAELLSRIRERNRLLADTDQHPPNPLDEHSELLTDIRNFISYGAVINNRATTQEILDRLVDWGFKVWKKENFVIDYDV